MNNTPSSSENIETTSPDSARVWVISSCDDVKKAVNGILEWADLKSLLLAKLHEVPNFSRVYLLRHLDVNKEEFEEYSELREEWRQKKEAMSKDHKERMDFLDNNMEIRDFNDEENLVNRELYWNILWTNCILYTDLPEQIKKRNKRTLEWIIGCFIKPWYLQCQIKPHDLHSNKNSTYGETTLNTWFQLCWINSAIKKQILDSPDFLKWKNIVILSNSSFAHSFQILWGTRDISPNEWSSAFRENNYDYFDIDKNGNPINNDDIPITPSNYRAICEFFSIEKGDLTLVQIQNGLNNFLRELKKTQEIEYFSLLERFLYSIQGDLREYAIKELIKNENIKTIEIYLFSEERGHLSEKEKEIILRNLNTSEKIKSLIQRHFVSYPELWEDSRTQMEKYFGKEKCTLLETNQETYREILKFQKKHSLDEMIQNQEVGSILARRVYSWQEKEKKYIWSQEILKNKWKYILRAHVWQWKSFWLTEFTKWATFWNEKVIFLKAKEFWSNNKRIDEIFEQAEREWIILCIDGIDEITTDNKEYIKNKLYAFQGMCVITARESEYPEKNTNFTTLMLEPMDADEFLESRFKWNEAKLQEIYSLLEKNHLEHEIKSNPLLLTLVVLLAKMDSENTKIYQEKYGIKSLYDIQNKSDLYESVVRFILAKHTKELKVQNYDPDKDLSRWMDQLSEYAFNIFLGNSEKTYNKTYDIHLGILFRKTQENEYDFIHKSFYEYFLARYLSKIDNGNDYIYNLRDEKRSGNWNDWRESRTFVLFYAEKLVEYEKMDTLERFLEKNGLLKHDDIFGENFFMGLEILYKLPKKIKNTDRFTRLLAYYTKRYTSWNINEVCKRFGSITSFTKKIGHAETRLSSQTILAIEKTGKLLIKRLKKNFRKTIEQINSSIDSSKQSKVYKEYVMEYIKQIRESCEIISQLWTKIAIDKAIEWISEIKKIVDSQYRIAEICWIDVTNNNIELMNKLLLLYIFPNTDKVVDWELQSILRSIKKIWNSYAIQSLKTEIETKINKENFREACYDYAEIAKIWTREAIQIAIEGAEKLITAGEGLSWLIYEAIAYVWTYRAIQEAKKGAEKLIIHKRLMEARWIYRALMELWTPQATQYAVDGAKEIGNQWWANLEKIYLAKVKIQDTQTEKQKLLSTKEIGVQLIQAETLVKTWKYNRAINIYKELSKLPTYIPAPSHFSKISSFFLFFLKKTP